MVIMVVILVTSRYWESCRERRLLPMDAYTEDRDGWAYWGLGRWMSVFLWLAED